MISSLDDSMRIPYLRGGRNMSDFPKGVVLENSLLSALTESERVRPGALDKSALSYSIEQEELLGANTIKEAILRDNSVMVAPTEQEQEQEQEQVQNEALEKSVTLTPTEQELLRANTIKEAMAHTWKGYEPFAFGHDELKPVTGGYDDNWMGMAATMIDGMDTLWIMDMKDEFNRARDYAVNTLDWDAIAKDVSVFETTIRAVGGLLSAAALSDDETLSRKAHDLMERMLPAFDRNTGLSFSRVELKTGRGFNYNWANGGILSEFGSLTLELNELSRSIEPSKTKLTLMDSTVYTVTFILGT